MSGKTHKLAAEPENIFWGYFDAATPPVLEIDSGDEVVLTCMPACVEADLPPGNKGVRADHLIALKAKAGDKGPGPHMMTGPVYVRGAEPGDVLQIDILDVKPIQDWGFTGILPLLGALPDEFTDYETIHIAIDAEAGTCTLPWGMELPLDPFFGIMGVAPPPVWGRVGSPEPRAFGGNMDNKDLRAGATLYLPVFNAGALFSAGDGHGRQGDGEVCIAAVETALEGRFRLTVRKDLKIETPFAETADELISMGFDEDLDEAMRKAVRDMIQLVTGRTHLTRNQAYMLLSLAADLKVTQVVDGEKGIHMVLPKKWL
ncbi:acetamidase/formamidase [Rhodobacter sp. 140A]|jgi:acetamidase/formamidase|uniref:acetamidase/formamidase family protein n=1 Tax=Thioclava TaxID=285107 RepID=UPI000C3B3DE0|nr:MULTISPECIES: acetamidase/formamidase family protein [Thioclava]MAQ38458.1 amidase [Thioclava sp.]RBP84948.1 acetamidase/formamidase [Rhodobacter sp. 140A]|tara:strand:- start:416 stop:1363 length:948 start_codon:yes stop_codon:yes gene_type:complete